MVNLPDFLTKDSDGFIHVNAHRIGLEHLVYEYNQGLSPEMLSSEFPSLSLALVHKLIAFYLENRSEVDRYISGCEDDVQRQRASAGKGPSLADLRMRAQSTGGVEST